MSEFYYYLWGLYALGALGVFYVSWRMLRKVKRPFLGPALIALIAAVLFTPWKLVPEQADLTPALMIALFDGIAEGGSGVWNGAKPILMVYIVLLLVLLAVYGVRHLLGKGSAAQ